MSMTISSRERRWFPVKSLLSVTVLALIAGASALAAPKPRADPLADKRYKNIELFSQVMTMIERHYVDDVSQEQLIHGALKGMMDTLDPHSAFLQAEVYRDMKVDTSGKFGGLGIEIGMKDNVLTVIAPIEDTPAWSAGLKPNDRIVKIDGRSTKGLGLTEAVSRMRGKPGSAVKLTIYRKGFDKLREVSVKREEIRISPVKNELLEPGIGYVRLKTFSENAADDMAKAIKKLEKGGKLKALVFDMRNTPGGLLDQAIEVSSLFIDTGVIVSTIGRNKDQKEIRHALPGKAMKHFPIALLVNSSTASAAEIVAGALQDHKRAIIMGQPTFGKGSVQSVMELDANAGLGLKLTIARYYTPSGRSIQEKGVYPDLVLDEYDPSLLEKARIVTKGMREKDLEGHISNESGQGPIAGDFSSEELEAMGKDKPDEVAKGSEDDPEMTPERSDPKSDYQVREAVNYLKSYEIFKKLAIRDDAA